MMTGFFSGMYTVRLDPDDFNSTKMGTFNGDLVYAQNKRQQVVMAEQFARQHPSIYFASWHPGNISLDFQLDKS